MCNTCEGIRSREHVRCSIQRQTNRPTANRIGRMKENTEPTSIYVPSRLVSKALRPPIGKRRLAPHEAIEYLHLSSCFSYLVLEACKQHKVTPQSATGAEFSLDELMLKAESMVNPSAVEIDNAERRRRRQFAYSSFVRSTAEGVKVRPTPSPERSEE